MKYFSVFTGAGGFELGIEYAMDNRHQTTRESEVVQEHSSDDSIVNVQGAFTCVGFSEIDKYASAVLKYRFPNTKNYGDIKTINWSDVPDFDLLVGGSPCQDLSVAGKRKGLSGERSGLFTEFIRALQEKEPSYFIWENVKGTLSSNKGWDFAEVQAQMVEAGYSLWWQVLNAKDFGVPQNRERVFVVGTLGGGGREVLFERGESESNDGENKKDRFINTLGKRSSREKIVKSICSSLTNNPMSDTIPMTFVHDRFNNKLKKEMGTIPATGTHGNRGFDIIQLNQGISDCRIRRLTPLEAERLMSWPDNWTRYGDLDGEVKEISDTQRYKMCGNGVVSAVVAEVVKELINK